MMSGGLIDKVYIGLDNAPAAFDIKGRILGPVSFCFFGLDVRILNHIENNVSNFFPEWH